ncbi:MAG: hypothetical protein P4L50_25545 [Anaerolineaceae bacterium]|nr:hypothetical protein [Anaerolineaceae bacterium]
MEEKRITTEEKTDSLLSAFESNEQIEHKHELVVPVIPLDFIEAELISTGGEVLWEWLLEHAPKPVQDLYNGVIFAAFVQSEALKNNGKIPSEENEDLGFFFFQALQAMKELGHKW